MIVLALSTWFSSALKYLKVAWAWTKRNWKFVSGFVLATTIFILTRKRFDWEKYHKKTKEDYEKEIEIIKKSHENELQDRNDALKKYDDAMKKIDKEHRSAIESLDKEKSKRVRKLIEESDDDPDILTEKISEITGFKIHK